MSDIICAVNLVDLERVYERMLFSTPDVKWLEGFEPADFENLMNSIAAVGEAIANGQLERKASR